MRPDAAGLCALRAAMAQARREELGRSARAARVGHDLLEGGRPPAYRVVTPSRVGVGPAVVPGPAPVPAGEVIDLAPPEGEVALSFALVQRAQAGDAEAFGQLYDRYLDQVFRYVYYRVGTQQVAEDLTSETFLRALRRIGSFTWQGRDVGAWFVTIARNLIADHYKSGRYRLELTTEDVTGSGPAPAVAGPESEVLETMQNEVLLSAVKQLGAEQQECIVLRFLQGLSVAETAQAMDKNEGAVKALQYRATRALGRLLPDGLEL